MKLATTQELNRARQLLSEDKVDLAILELRKLHNKYPDDHLVLYELGTLLLRQDKNVPEALFFLKQTANSRNKYAIANEIGIYYLNHGKYEEAIKRFESLRDTGKDMDKCYCLYGLIKVYIHTNEFDKALKCFDELRVLRHTVNFDLIHYYNLKFYLLTMNNKNPNEEYADNYFRKQLIDYSREAAIEHIKGHLKDVSEDERIKYKRTHSVFDKSVDIEAIYDYCEEKIKDMEPLGRGEVDNYRCKFENVVGAAYGKIQTTYVEITTFPNTKKILSIYPVNNNHVAKQVEEKTEERKQPKSKKYKKSFNKNKKNR
jgi:pentatricopeptide repeat protein